MNEITVLNHIKANPDVKFTSDMLAKKFEISVPSMTVLLKKLDGKVQNAIIAKRRRYFVDSAETARRKENTDAMLVIQAAKQRPLKETPAMRIARDRCKELYPNGGNFKTIC